MVLFILKISCGEPNDEAYSSYPKNKAPKDGCCSWKIRK
jgi:hypothetical protein